MSWSTASFLFLISSWKKTVTVPQAEVHLQHVLLLAQHQERHTVDDSDFRRRPDAVAQVTAADFVYRFAAHYSVTARHV